MIKITQNYQNQPKIQLEITQHNQINHYLPKNNKNQTKVQKKRKKEKQFKNTRKQSKNKASKHPILKMNEIYTKLTTMSKKPFCTYCQKVLSVRISTVRRINSNLANRSAARKLPTDGAFMFRCHTLKIANATCAQFLEKLNILVSLRGAFAYEYSIFSYPKFDAKNIGADITNLVEGKRFSRNKRVKRVADVLAGAITLYLNLCKKYGEINFAGLLGEKEFCDGNVEMRVFCF